MSDDEFNSLCNAHGFGAVASGECPLVSSGMLKVLVDAAYAAGQTEAERTPDQNDNRHTPGPWVINRLIDGDGKPYTTCYQAHIDIGPCMIWCPIGHSEQEANARLIAAAPEMFDLLEDIDNRIGEITEEAWEKLQGIIKRVKGNQ